MNLPELGRKELFFRYCLLNQQKVLGWLGLAVGVCILAIVFANSGSGAKTTQDAKVAFEQWKKAPKDELLTKEMEKALEKAPSLKRALESEIVQIMLSEGAMPTQVAAGCIERLKGESPFHAEFAKASLLIEQKEFQKALELSVTLKERLEPMAATSELYGWNLLRLAFLHKQLGNSSGELAAWDEVKTYMQREELMATKFYEMGIGRADFTLADFIALREREITPD